MQMNSARAPLEAVLAKGGPMARRENDRDDIFEDQAALERLIDAVERDDARALERIRAELASRDDIPLLELEHEAERAAGARRDADRAIDRLRNIFQALLLNRWLTFHRRRHSDRGRGPGH